MSAHTPGPWMAHGMNVGVAGIRGTRPPLITVASIYPSNDDNAKQAEADARLIAAAPELLEALQLLRVRDSDGPNESACWCPAEHKRGRAIKEHEHTAECCVARAAIAKAEGRS